MNNVVLHGITILMVDRKGNSFWLMGVSVEVWKLKDLKKVLNLSRLIGSHKSSKKNAKSLLESSTVHHVQKDNIGNE